MFLNFPPFILWNPGSFTSKTLFVIGHLNHLDPSAEHPIGENTEENKMSHTSCPSADLHLLQPWHSSAWWKNDYQNVRAGKKKKEKIKCVAIIIYFPKSVVI